MKTKHRNRYWPVIAVIAGVAAAIALGCVFSGDGPLLFLYRLFTLNYLPALETGASLVTMALFGFLASFHCIGMCGGIVLSQCAGREQGGTAQGLMYSAGRIVSYTLVGFLSGLLGTVIGLNGYLKGLVPLLCAAVMLVMGFNMLGLFRWLGGELRVPQPGIVKKLQGRGAFLVGFVTGFMPCGMLQMAELYALGTGNPRQGALSMFVFSLASAPVLFAFGALAGSLTVKKRTVIMKAAAIIVVLLGVKLLLKALALLGVV